MGFQTVSKAAGPAVEKAQQLYREQLIKQHVIEAVNQAQGGGPGFKAYLTQVLCAALETVGADAPRGHFWGAVRDDAEWWADIATPVELEAYVGAGLRAITRRTFAPSAKKRLFVALWASMSDGDRKAFLKRVDPKGKFVRGAE